MPSHGGGLPCQSASTLPPTMSASGNAAKAAAIDRTHVEPTRTSSSVNARSAPADSAMPRLRAYESPWAGSRTARTRPVEVKRDSTAAVSSVELLSTTTTSYGGASACSTKAVSASARRAARLYVQTTTVTSTVARSDRAVIFVRPGLRGLDGASGPRRDRARRCDPAVEPAGEVPDGELAGGGVGGVPQAHPGLEPGAGAAERLAPDVARHAGNPRHGGRAPLTQGRLRGAVPEAPRPVVALAQPVGV